MARIAAASAFARFNQDLEVQRRWRNHRSWRFFSPGFGESGPSEPAAAACLEVVGDEGHHLVVEMVDQLEGWHQHWRT